MSYMRQGSVENPTIRLSDFWSKCSSESCSYLPSIKCNQDFINSLDLPAFITPCTKCVSGPYQMHLYVHVCGRPPQSMFPISTTRRNMNICITKHCYFFYHFTRHYYFFFSHLGDFTDNYYSFFCSPHNLKQGH